MRSRRISRRSAGVNLFEGFGGDLSKNHVNPNVCSCSRERPVQYGPGLSTGLRNMGSGLARIVSLWLCRWRWAAASPRPRPAECPGNPDALGTSRTIVVDPREHVRIGTMDYAETLPLADREVVLTFDDGPIPPYTGKVLDILAAECVKATYFIVGDHGEGISGAGAARL